MTIAAETQVNTELDQLRAQLEEATARAVQSDANVVASEASVRAANEKAAAAEVSVLISKLSASNDLRFTRAELPVLQRLLVSTKQAAFSASAEVQAFAASIEKDLTEFVSLKSAVAPTSKLPIGEDTQPPAAADSITLDDFKAAGSDRDAAAKITRVVAERQKTDPAFDAAALLREVEHR